VPNYPLQRISGLALLALRPLSDALGDKAHGCSEETMSTPPDLKDLWTVGGVLLGFQVTAFSWRVAQESRAAEQNKIVWLPPADYLNLLAMVLTSIGCFVAPVVAVVSVEALRAMLGLAALLFLGHAVALAGHYELYSRGRNRSFVWWPPQEKVAILLVALVVTAYLGLILVRASTESR